MQKKATTVSTKRNKEHETRNAVKLSALRRTVGEPPHPCTAEGRRHLVCAGRNTAPGGDRVLRRPEHTHFSVSSVELPPAAAQCAVQFHIPDVAEIV